MFISVANFATTGTAFFQLLNSNRSTIGGSAAIDINATNVSASQLFVAILNNLNDGKPSGTVAGSATVNFNLSGTATVATDATFQINGSDSARSSVINVNGGTYTLAEPSSGSWTAAG